MMNPIFNLYSYLLLNAAMMIAYIMMRIVFAMPFFSRTSTQYQRLNFARYSFLGVMLIFFLIPIVTAHIPMQYQSNFHLEPIIKNASMVILKSHSSSTNQLNLLHTTNTFLSVNYLLTMLFFIGVIFYIYKYIKNIITLNQLTKDSFCKHKMNRVNILFNESLETPFCWSLLRNHYIAVPHQYLQKTSELKLALRHELQHIRQGDTYFLHIYMLIKSFCFWNPFVFLWVNWLQELQEFSCDESVVLRKKTSVADYAQCLINAASDELEKGFVPQGALGIHGLSKSILYRRVNMLFNYKNRQVKKVTLFAAYILSLCVTVSTAYALNGTSSTSPLSTQQIENIITKSHLNPEFQISATPEVVSEVNNIRGSEQARKFMQDSLKRMKQYQGTIQSHLKQKNMPTELLAVPLVESGYQPLDGNKNPAAGIWQIIPSTANNLNLVVNANRDDRLNTELATKAALVYLNSNHKQFNNWMLAVVAYEYGEERTDAFIKKVGSRDVWVLANSPDAPKDFKKFVAMFDAGVIMIKNPGLVS